MWGKLNVSAMWLGGTAPRLQILRDGFDSRLEPITFDDIPGGCYSWLKERILLRSLPELPLNFLFNHFIR